MNSAELFLLSEKALTEVVDQISDNQWEIVVPKGFTIQEGEWTVRKLINYHAYDDAWVPETLAGKTIAEVGTKYDGDLLGSDPKANWLAIVDKSVEAVKNVDLKQTVHLSYGDYPAEEYLYHITLFRTFRAVDFGRLLNIQYHLPDALIEGIWKYIVPNAAYFRQIGVIGEEIKVPEDAPLIEKLLALTGRQPKD